MFERVQISWVALVFSDPSIEFPFGLPDVKFFAILAGNGIDYTAYLIF